MERTLTDTKGFVFDIKKFAVHDGPGIRTTVFFKGCPLKCSWCHNPESREPLPETYIKINRRKCLDLSYSETKEVIGKEVTADEIMGEIIKDLACYEESGGGVTFSGGEPLMQPGFLHELLSSCGGHDIHTAIDTSGYASSGTFRKIAAAADLFLYDLKIIDNKNHLKFTGVDNKIILKNLAYLNEIKKDVIVRIPVVDYITNTEENIDGILNHLFGLKNIKKVSLLPYHNFGEKKWEKLNMESNPKRGVPPSVKEMNELKNKFESKGFIVDIGN